MSGEDHKELFREEAVQSATESLIGRVFIHTPLGIRMLTVLLAVVVAAIIVFLATGDYARRELVSGYLAIESDVAKVFSPQRGIVTKVHAAEGETVSEGQPLVTISTARYTEQGASVTDLQAAELKQQQEELVEQIQAERERLALNLERLKRRMERRQEMLDNLARQIEIETKRVRLLEAQSARLGSLRQHGDVSVVQLEEADVQLLAARLQLDQLEARRIETRAERDQLEYERGQLRIDVRRRISELEMQARDVGRQLTELAGNESFTLHASREGVVTALQAAVGQNVGLNTALLALIPASARYHAELLVPTNAIGFVEPGQPVDLLYAAFPYQKFGSFPGVVERIGRTVLTPDELVSPMKVDAPAYRVRVRLQHQTVAAYGQEYLLQPGMLLQASIVFDERSLLQWLLDPIYTVTKR